MEPGMPVWLGMCQLAMPLDVSVIETASRILQSDIVGQRSSILRRNTPVAGEEINEHRFFARR
jgi:hypothetical protein